MAGVTSSTAVVVAELRKLLQEHDLTTLSERNVRELMAERCSWSAEELQEHKPLIKAEIERFLDNLQQNVEASEPAPTPEQQVHSSQVALRKRKAAAAPDAGPPAKVARDTAEGAAPQAPPVKAEPVKAEVKEEAAGPWQAPVKPEDKVEAAGPSPVSANDPASLAAAAGTAAPSAAAAAMGSNDQQAGSSNGLPIMLSRARRADVSEYKGKTFVNIREYYEKEGEWRPGQKGIALSPEQFQTLRGAARAISEALQAQDTSYRLALSGRRVARVKTYNNTVMVDIREVYEKDSQELPGKKGISLVADQWSALVAGLPALQAALP